MKKFASLITIGVILPAIVFAQKWDIPLSDDGFAYASFFASNLSLLLSIVIGIIANFIVFRAARKLGGGLFGSVLNYIGIGMTSVVLGTISTVVDSWLVVFWPNVIGTVFFATGYIFMVIGAEKLFKGIMSA